MRVSSNRENFLRVEWESMSGDNIIKLKREESPALSLRKKTHGSGRRTAVVS